MERRLRKQQTTNLIVWRRAARIEENHTELRFECDWGKQDLVDKGELDSNNFPRKGRIVANLWRGWDGIRGANNACISGQRGR